LGRENLTFLKLSATLTVICHRVENAAAFVDTSFLAVYLTFRRNPFFALAYAANDVILIVLWTLASQHDPTYISVTVCFISFLVNDLYGFWAWRKMERKQNETEKST